MKQETDRHKIAWRLAIALILAVSLWLASPLPAAAQSVGEYFQISYDQYGFSKNEINGSEVFYLTIKGRATCTQDLPLPIGEASITSRIVAKHTVSGAEVTLNPGYTVTIKPFPTKVGATVEINQVVSLQFPAEAESGDYDAIARVIEAKVKLGFAPLDVTGYLPQEQLLDSLKYTAQESTPTPTSTPTPAPAPTSTLTPAPTTASTPTPTYTPSPTPAPSERYIPWWVWLIVVAAIATTAVNIVWLLRHHQKSTSN